jgi:hypothetical protein
LSKIIGGFPLLQYSFYDSKILILVSNLRVTSNMNVLPEIQYLEEALQ